MTFMLWAIDVPQMSLQREAKMRKYKKEKVKNGVNSVTLAKLKKIKNVFFC